MTDDPSNGQPRLLVVEARFYEDIGAALLDSATRELAAAGVAYDVVRVPGALEIPQIVARACDDTTYDGCVALGCVIRGETSHYDTVANETSRALMDLAVLHRMPLGNGLLTVENEAQAWARINSDDGGKGAGAVRACLAVLIGGMKVDGTVQLS